MRTNILATMERKIAADAERALLRKDIAEFDKTCGDGDPDARTVFQAALQEMEPARSVLRLTTLTGNDAGGCVAATPAAGRHIWYAWLR